MFRALLCPSSGARDYDVYLSLHASKLQPTANQERNDQFGHQPHSREHLMMDIVVPETCWAYKKYNKMISGI